MNMPKEKDSVWTIGELVALTDDVQEESLEYRGKKFSFQYCELVEAEEPKFTGIPDNATEEEKNAIYQELGAERILGMIEKANVKNPDSVSITRETWPLLPSSVRYNLTAKVLNISSLEQANFPNG